MAKQSGIFQIEGTLENVTFYKSAEGGYMVRKKSGVSKERIMNDPAYVRTRENLNQFGLNAKAGKLLRETIPTLLKKGKDSRVSSRLSKIMGEIAKHDHLSVRGQKKAALGIAIPEGIAWLKGFNFNKRAILSTILAAPCQVDNTTGVVTIASFIPEEQIAAPQGATHVGFRSGFTAINFETGVTETAYSPKVILPLNLTPESVTLTPETIPVSDAGSKRMVVLLLEFFQEVDGIKYPLSNGAHNALNILDMV